ncbi:glycosyltransferase family 4 protein [Corynebacterium singulare]|nr:glycosyltransferase family 4 protein [Corynebacterium singulare]
MPVRTVAEWGGVHEWTVDAASSLVARGNDVTFVGQGDTFRERAQAVGASFVEIDWSEWSHDIERIARDVEFDLIFSHAPGGRQIGLAVNEIAKKEHVVMVHGAYHDYMYEWSDQVDAFVAASPSLVHFVQRFGRVAPWKVTNLPNAAPSEIFNLPLVSHDEKLSGGVGRILTASRLSPDKVPQIAAVEEAAESLSHLYPDIEWVIDIYGDGPLKAMYEQRYAALSQRLANVNYEFHGWVAPHEVPILMNKAFLTVTAGMAGMRALAAGSLCLGAGARDTVGIQVGSNLRAGLWSNFGDHGVQRFGKTDVKFDLNFLSDPDRYDEAVRVARDKVLTGNNQDLVNNLMFSALNL